jgi:hypothetical protein
MDAREEGQVRGGGCAQSEPSAVFAKRARTFNTISTQTRTLDDMRHRNHGVAWAGEGGTRPESVAETGGRGEGARARFSLLGLASPETGVQHEKLHGMHGPSPDLRIGKHWACHAVPKKKRPLDCPPRVDVPERK